MNDHLLEGPSVPENVGGKAGLPHVCFVALNAYPLLVDDSALAVVGGAELQQVLVARELVKRGYPVSMVCLDFGQEDEVVIDGIRVIRAYRPAEGIPGIRFIWPRLVRLWRCLRVADADIYYQRTASMLTGVVALYARQHGRKSVFAAAGNPDLERPTSRIRFARDRWIFEYGVRRVDLVLVQNEEQRRLCHLMYGREARHVPNCGPVPPQRAEGRGRCILWVSTIRSIKRPRVFLELARTFPQYRFRMIGGPSQGEGQLFKEIQEDARSISNLEFLGFVPYRAIDAHFDDALLFLNTSESEGFPNTFLQSWARGIPTLSFFDCGARYDGRPVGLTASSKREMEVMLMKLLEDDAERERQGSLCLDYFLGHHAPEAVLDLYEAVFKELGELGDDRVPLSS